MTNPDEAKDIFYQQLDELIRNVPSRGKLIVMGDFNARIGADYTAWIYIIGTHGIGSQMANGKLLVSLCSQHNLAITNTFFKLKDKYKTNLIHQISKHWHHIDHDICRQNDLKDFRITKTMRGTECSTNHVNLKLSQNIKMQHKRRPQCKKSTKKLDVGKGNLVEN